MLKIGKCPICKNNQSIYKKQYLVGDKFIQNPNEFILCSNCLKIEENKIIRLLGCEPFYWVKIF